MGQEEVEALIHQEAGTENATDTGQGEELNIMEAVSEISMNALSGQFHPNTLWVVGSFARKEVRILIDNGSNNNFIRPATVKKLKLHPASIVGV